MGVTDTTPEQDAAYAALHTVYARLTSLEDTNERLQRELTDARRDGAAHRREAEDAREGLQRITAEFEQANEELQREYAAAVGEQAAACTALPLDGLLTAYSGLQRAATATELLESMVHALAREFSRVALFHVRGQRLQGAWHTGFDIAFDISKIAIPMTSGTLLARAVSSRQLESLMTDGGSAPVLPFGGTPACAIAIPIGVGQDVASVVYADDSDTPGFTPSPPHTRLKFAELLRQHACLLLLKMAAQQHDGRYGRARE